MFQDFLNKKNIELYSRNTHLGDVFAERFNRTIRDHLKQPVFEEGDGNWIHVLTTKWNNNRVHNPTKLSPKDASLKKNEGYVYNNLLDKRKRINTKFQVNDLVRTADLKKTFSKFDSTNWSYRLYKIIETIIDTIPSYKIDNLKETYNEALLKKTELTMKENDGVMKKLHITSIKLKWRWPSLLILINPFVNTTAYPYIPAGTTPSNLNSTLIGWADSKIFWYLISKTYKL